MESTDANIRNVLAGMTRAAPRRSARLRDLIARGRAAPRRISAPDLADAVRHFAQLRSERGARSMIILLRSTPSTRRPPSGGPCSKRSANIPGAPVRLADYITSLVDDVDRLGDPRQADMFGGVPDHEALAVLDRPGAVAAAPKGESKGVAPGSKPAQAPAVQTVDRLAPVELTLSGWTGTAPELAVMAREVYTRVLQGTSVENASLGAPVAFTSEGKSEAFGVGGRLRNAVRAELVQVLRELVQQAVPVQELPAGKGRTDSRAFHTLVSPMRVNGDLYAVKLIIREGHQAPLGMPVHKFYNVAIAKMKGSLDANGIGDTTASLHPSPVEAPTVSIADLTQAHDLGAPVAAEQGPTPPLDSPDVAAAREALAAAPDLLVPTVDGQMVPARTLLEEADALVAQARNNAEAFGAAVRCALGAGS